MNSAGFLHFNFFENGDGILGVWDTDRICPQRPLLTDSSHCLLRIDLFRVPTDERLNATIANRLYSNLMHTQLPRATYEPNQYATAIGLMAIVTDADEDEPATNNFGVEVDFR